MTLESAEKYANELLAVIQPFCVKDRCLIAGSIRRRVPNPKDIELVAVPDLTDFEKMDGIRKVLRSGTIGTVLKGMFPSRYTQVKGPFCNIDMFWCSKQTYGLNLWIRSGPADYAARGLAFWKRITNGGYSEGAILHLADGTQVPTFTEQAVFDAFTQYSGKPVKFLAPELRR